MNYSVKLFSCLSEAQVPTEDRRQDYLTARDALPGRIRRHHPQTVSAPESNVAGKEQATLAAAPSWRAFELARTVVTSVTILTS